VIIKMVTY